jgi:hypothetical protein
MHPTLRLVLLLGPLVLLLPAAPARAADDPPPTYTAEELRALDRALDAANLDREDLRFDKDLAKGLGCLPLVRTLLNDPLAIAPTMDDLARRLTPADGAALDPARVVEVAAHLLGTPRTGATVTPAAPEDPETALQELAALVGQDLEPLFEALADDPTARQAVRRHLPGQMAWHEVFASPYDAATDTGIDAWTKGRDPAWLHEAMLRLDLAGVLDAYDRILGGVPGWVATWPASAFPEDGPRILDTPHGRVGLGTRGPDVWEGDFTAIVDPGGDDTYLGGRVGAAHGLPGQRIGLLVDLGGNDRYDAPETDLTMGAAVLGIALLADLGQGDDRYRAGHASLGAALGGVGILLDDGGSDTYAGRSYTQGAAGFGLGALLDDGLGPRPVTTRDEGTPDPVTIGQFDNDRLSAWAEAQGFARCRGIALCWNRRGNETYEAGGVYLHAPLFADRYQSFSQGFAIGQRDTDHAGGVALLLDLDGNDRYLGDIYNQGVGYWYAAGLLHDRAGNDLYEMTQYGQGSGIHLAVGGLVDEAGNDTYVMHSGLGQGGSHDYAASVLHDRGGNDRYLGSTSCNGCGLTNSVGLHLDRSGDDIYAARREGGINTGRPARGFGSIGVLVDLGGKDDYLGVMADDAGWRHTDVGVGLDLEAPVTEATTGGAASPEDEAAPIPAICSYEGELTAAVFDELWALAIRWEVGDNRRIVPVARERLAAFGEPVIAHLDRVMGTGAGGLEIRGYVGVLQPLLDGGLQATIEAMLQRNLGAEDAVRPTVALQVIAELKLSSLEGAVAALLGGADRSRARRAAGVLRALGSTEGRHELLTWLAPGHDERETAAALEALLGSGAEVYPAVRPLLAHPHLSVRGRLVGLLAARPADYRDAVVADVVGDELTLRQRRTLLEVLTRMEGPPGETLIEAVASGLGHADAGYRTDTIRLLRTWQQRPDADAQALAPALERLAAHLAEETDPFALAAGRS